MAFNANMPYNPFGPNPPLLSDSIRSPDTRSDPGAPTDQSLAPPPMPVRADSRPDFVRGFGLDVPDETEEELEQEEGQTEEDDQSVLEEHEEERVLGEASHIALAGTDDTMDMELDVDEADAEVGSITTAAQSRVHSRHVSRLSATLSVLSVGSHVSDTELRAARNVPGEREGDLEDVGEWTGSEDLRTTAETTEDEVRKVFAALFTRVHTSVSIYMITSPCFVFSHSHPLSSLLHFPWLFFSFSSFVSRRASASGQTHLTKNVLAKHDITAASCVVPTIDSSKI